ncbi:MAG: sugar ABC transporter permease [Anaerolineales bacterium]|nr:sugar ABC transporter permease [Anaerolineales bacterium]
MEKQRLFSRLAGYFKSNAGREAVKGYVFISPWLVGLLVFQAIPLVMVFYFSLTKYSVLSSPEWIGLDNYIKIFTKDDLFLKSIWNTVYIVALSVPLRLIFAFLLALLLNNKVRHLGIFRTIYYLPMIVPIAATAVLWEWMFQPRYGIINFFLNLVGISGVNWLVTTTWSKPSIVIVSLWRIGEAVVLFLAGLQGISQELYEAAEVDGAKSMAKLFKITIPLITPTILLQVIIEIIHIFQSFVWSFSMTEGGPMNSSLTYVLYIYRKAFVHFQMGYASALSVILFILVLILTMFVFKSSKSWVHSEVEV